MWRRNLTMRKRSRAARACCARRWGRESPSGSTTRASSRSCSIPTGGSGSIGLKSGLEDAGASLSPEDGERIVRLVAHHVGAEVHANAPRVSAELPETGERFEGLLPPVVAAPTFAIRKPAVAVFTLDDYVVERHHQQKAGGGSARRRRDAHEHLGRGWNVDRQDDARQRAARGSRQDCRPRSPHRRHARTAMRRAKPRVAPHQGRRGELSLILVRSSLRFVPRPHSDWRSARRRGARSSEGLGHRAPRRCRHHSRRLGARGAASASSSSSRKPWSRFRAR